MSEIIIALLKKLLTKGVTVLWENKNSLSLYLKTLFWKYRNKDIRFSISYLFRIKIPESNNYLLVPNRRISNQLQPVGGVYKRYGDDKLFEKWGYIPDNKKNGLDVDKDSDGDLRFRVKGKNCIKVIKWFEEAKEREVSAEREFYEELVNTNILPLDLFHHIKYKHLKRFSKHLKWSNHHSCYEILIYDIFELIPSPEQIKSLKNLSNKDNNLKKGFAIVSCDDIEQLRLMKNDKQIARIGEHTKLIINKTF
ncbi:HU-CCDC81 and SPOR domain-containing protein [Confluentibacter sediminis]|uniref:SMODS-associated NUDIX domain-containing protein n=1 Tax=Confluentibacter sediminis TaxID=2219045 RepID=UPI000DADE02C|nr:HU-CCDC81 and SPOR domain-containing protein [Confluentibacter sediminis]